jgi:hypothetical protein
MSSWFMKLDGLIPCFILVSSTTWSQLPLSHKSTSQSHSWLTIPSTVFISGMQTNVLYPLLPCTMHATCPASLEIRTASITYSCGRWVGLTTLPHSCTDCLEIWEPQLPGNFGACPGLYRDWFTFSTTYSPIPAAARCKVWVCAGRLLGLCFRIPPITWMYMNV